MFQFLCSWIAWNGSLLFRVKLDDQLFVQLNLYELFTFRLCEHPAFEIVSINLEPVGRGRMRGGVAGSQDGWIVLALLTDFQHVVGPDLKRRDVHLVTVYQQMAVPD